VEVIPCQVTLKTYDDLFSLRLEAEISVKMGFAAEVVALKATVDELEARLLEVSLKALYQAAVSCYRK